jgi:riboflavin kinase/FMN adenylyltransferase
MSMTIDEDLSRLTLDRDSALTIGVFDGVHLGHWHLIRNLISEADRTGRLSAVVTFRNHPTSVLRQGPQLPLLMDLDDRIGALKQLGVDVVVPVAFDTELSQLSAQQFLTKLADRLRMRSLVVGPDFTMGHNRDGTVETLPALSRTLGYSFRVVDPLIDQQHMVKSTAIRKLVAVGDVKAASRMLGRNFAARGVVVKGLERGRTLGFPTANLEMPERLAVPGDGIYATWAQLPSGRYMAATSIGTRPTFDEGVRTIEAFILDFSDEIYGQNLRLEFVQRLRQEEKFDSVEALLAQMGRDVEQTRELLTARGPS